MLSFPPGTCFEQEYVRPLNFEFRGEEPWACHDEMKAAPQGPQPWLCQVLNSYCYRLNLCLGSVIFHSRDVITFHFQLQTQSTTSFFNLLLRAT